MYQLLWGKNVDKLHLVLQDWQCLKMQMLFKSSEKTPSALRGSERQDGVRNIFIVPLKLSKTERQQQNSAIRRIIIIPIMGMVQINVCVWRELCFTKQWVNTGLPGCQHGTLINVYLSRDCYSLTFIPIRNPLLHKSISCFYVRYSVIPGLHDVHVVIHAELFIYGITSVLKAHFCIYITPE